MIVTELDSFVLKFKNLCLARSNANLTMNTIAGKVTLCLQVELDGLLPPQQHQLLLKTRNGPSQQKRREKRAAARKVAAEKAVAEVTPEETAVLVLAEEAARRATAGIVMSEEDVIAKNDGGKDTTEKVLLVEPEDEMDLREMKETEESEFKVHWEYERTSRGHFRDTLERYFEGVIEDVKDFKEIEKIGNNERFSMILVMKPGFGRKHLEDVRYWPYGSKILEIE